MADSNDGALVPDIFDADSAISVPVESSLTSIRSSILEFQEENGHTYHSLSAGKYAYPNDDAENERLDLQHYVWLLTLRGELALCPKVKGAKRVLDVGTGTGIWATEYADLHPESEVIGVDLSPIQPSLVPPNCSFELDDVEKEWTWSKPFDFIISRAMAGSLADYQAYISKAFCALEPGGYIEMQDFCVPYRSDDDTLKPDMPVYRLSTLYQEAATKLGRYNDKAIHYKDMMLKAGFEGVTEQQFKWPLNPWPLDKHYKDIGKLMLYNVDTGLDGVSMALFTRGLGWSPEEVTVFCASARKQLRDQRIHAYLPIYVVYGRKPMDTTTTTDAPAARSSP